MFLIALNLGLSKIRLLRVQIRPLNGENRLLIAFFVLYPQNEYYCAGDVALPLRWCAPETLRCTDTTIETKEVSFINRED